MLSLCHGKTEKENEIYRQQQEQVRYVRKNVHPSFHQLALSHLLLNDRLNVTPRAKVHSVNPLTKFYQQRPTHNIIARTKIIVEVDGSFA